MSIPYLKRYTNNGTPKALPAITVSAGMKKSVAVGFPSRGILNRFTLKQTGGTSVGITVEILDSKVPFPPGEYPTAAVPADDLELYRITPTLSGAAGAVIGQPSDQMGYKYQNQDGTFSDAQRFIYLLLAPQGAAGATTWDLVMVGEGPS